MKLALEGVKTFFLANLETILLEIEAEYTVTIERWKVLCTHESRLAIPVDQNITR